MPYRWLPPIAPATAHLHLWPHRSLPRRGFVWFIAATATLLTLPLLALLGTAELWVLLPFLVAAVAGVWFALQHSYKTGEITEDLTITADTLTLTRLGPRGKHQTWAANPYWTRLTLHQTAGPVPNYLTLTGNGREVELGAFLSEPERLALHADLASRLPKP
jgi:uncharacterized membrane protein